MRLSKKRTGPSDPRGSVRGASGELFTPKEIAFVHAYLETGYVSEAAKIAGYGGNEKHWNAWLQKPKMQAEIEVLSRHRQERADIRAIDVIKELGRIAFSDLRDVATWDQNGLTLKPSSELSNHAARSIKSITERTQGDTKVVSVELWDKNKAADTLARVLGMMVNKMHITGNVRTTIAAETMDPNEQAAQIMAVLGEIQGNLLGQQQEVIDVSGTTTKRIEGQ